MLPLTRSRNRARFFGIPFSPSSLFAAGEQGAWYDPSDYSTLFTDSAGTTPVSAPGNGSDVFVGLMLDKSKGLVLGPELVTNGDFESGLAGTKSDGSGSVSTWAPNTSAPISGLQDGRLVITTAVIGNFPRLSFAGTGSRVIGATYLVSVDFKVNSGSPIISFVGADAASLVSVNRTLAGSGTATFRIVATNTANTTMFAFGNAVCDVQFDNISVRELPGNHAFQTSSAKRPKLAARYNLLTYSEEFDQGAWARTGIAAFGSGSVANTTATTDPLGGNTADFLLPFNASSRQRVNQGATVQTSTQMRMTCYIKPGGYNKVALRESNTSGYYVSFDLSSTTSPTILASSNATGTVSHVGNGWFLCSMTTTIVGTNFGASVYVLSPTYTTGDPETPVWSPDQVSGIYVWGADLRPASQATGLIGPTYQRVAAANAYDTAGFLPYLAFNGLSWSMGTNSIDFSAGDKMTVWAGVRKLSDALQGQLVELSADINTNNGSFSMPAAAIAGNAWTSGLRGTSSISASATGYVAPITTVNTAVQDIALSADEVVLRINGVQVATSGASSAGTGNYGNYPLYIGARNNASLFFNGWLTSLIVRGAQSTQSQIEATEAWVNGKTGAY